MSHISFKSNVALAICALGAIVFTHPILAQPKNSSNDNLSVKEINTSRKRLTISGPKSQLQAMNPGYWVRVELGDGRGCDLEVLENRETLVIADTALCPHSAEF